MCRNQERTLFVAITDDKKSLFWASESWMLCTALARNGIKHGEIASVIKDKHLVWKLKGNGDIELDEVNDAAGGKKKTWGIASWWAKEKNTEYWEETGATTATNDVIQPLHHTEFEEDYAETTSGRFVTRRRFESFLKDGCCNCTGDLAWEDREKIVWVDDESPVCLDCAEHMAGKKKVM